LFDAVNVGGGHDGVLQKLPLTSITRPKSPLAIHCRSNAFAGICGLFALTPAMAWFPSCRAPDRDDTAINALSGHAARIPERRGPITTQP
jgi:hypothetical protein